MNITKRELLDILIDEHTKLVRQKRKWVIVKGVPPKVLVYYNRATKAELVELIEQRKAARMEYRYGGRPKVKLRPPALKEDRAIEIPKGFRWGKIKRVQGKLMTKRAPVVVRAAEIRRKRAMPYRLHLLEYQTRDYSRT